MPQETILEILKRLPLDILISLVSIVVVIGAIVLIPFWVKRVEKRMADIHAANQKLHAFGLTLERHGRRLRILEDSGDALERRVDNKFEQVGLALNSIQEQNKDMKDDLGAIKHKLNIV